MKTVRPRIRLCLEQLEDRIVPSSTPSIDLTYATTTDSRTITMNYTVNNGSLVGHDVSLSIYRSSAYDSLTGAQLIGTVTIPGFDKTDLSAGTHTGVKVALTAPNGQPVTSLTPNTALPFIVVVANSDGSSASFETHVLGVIVHGSEFDPIQILLNQAPPWELQMAAALQAIDGYEAVIPFNWIRLCIIPSPLAVQMASNMLYQQVVAQADQLASQHPGDVVDINFIGDSRGTVVVSQVLQALNGTTDPALQGGFMQMTLLDPHPANRMDDLFRWIPSLSQANDLALLGFLIDYLSQDPQIVVPPNVDRVLDFDEQTPPGQSGFLNGFLATHDPTQLLEFMFSLWGEQAASIIDQSDVAIEQTNLTNVFLPGLGLIGHAEVPLWYMNYVVDANSTFNYIA
ncbi:MAG TPA: hypothetical protein VH592_07005 [Gemmataceae bacterium]